MEILKDSRDYIVINKPARILVYRSYYARNIKEKSVLDILEEQFSQKLFPIHRLDYKTTGVLLFAKSKEFAQKAQASLVDEMATKKYIAVVRGFTDSKGVVDTPVKNPETGVYKEALTEYKTLSSIETKVPVEPYSTSRYSIVELEPKTGRTHQLRIHCNKIAHPIIGDHKYGNRHHNNSFVDRFGYDFMYLHAKNLTLPDLEINVEAPYPDFWHAPLSLFSAE